jgi:hypothetical protein
VRTKLHASAIIRCHVRLPKEREEVRVLGKQLLRSGTSVAAHAREASRARSDAESCSKLEGLLQEADESQDQGGLRPPRGHPEATLRPSGGQLVGTLKPPAGYPEATPRLPRGYPGAAAGLPVFPI